MSTTDQITVGELMTMLRGVDNKAKVSLIVLDDQCTSIKMQGFMDYIIKPKNPEDDVVFYAGGQAAIGDIEP